MAKAQAYLLYTRAGRRARKVELRSFPFRIGRDADCQLRIDEPLVSPVHAVLDRAGEVYQLANRGVNGTRLQGRPVRGVRTLRPGERVEIGEHAVLELVLREEKAAAPASPRGSGWLDRRRALWIGIGTYAVVLVGAGVALAALDLSSATGRATPELARRSADATRDYLVAEGRGEDAARSVSQELDALLFRAWRLESGGRRQAAIGAYRDVVRLVPSLRAPTTRLASSQIRRLEEQQ